MILGQTTAALDKLLSPISLREAMGKRLISWTEMGKKYVHTSRYNRNEERSKVLPLLQVTLHTLLKRQEDTAEAPPV